MPSHFFSQAEVFWLLIPVALLVGLEYFVFRRQWFLIITRLLWASLLVLLLADWTQRLSSRFSEASPVLVVYDRSDSVSKIPERQQRVREFLSEIEQWSRDTQQPVSLFSFAESWDTEEWSRLRFGGFETHWEGIRELLQGDYSSVVVMSDGQFKPNLPSSIPVYSVQVGRDDEQDVWVSDLSPVQTAFLKNRVQLPVEISQRGFQGREIRVQLKKAGRLIDEQVLVLSEGENTLEFSYFPEKMGEEILSVEVEALEGELSALNNLSHFRLRTVRDKIRILHINGKPSLDLKAWRLFLTRQPDVDLVSFYILRSPEDEPQAKNDELSLIPFPYEDLFTTELEKFDIVIIQNFNFSLYFSRLYLRNLANFVRSGGSLLLFGGDQAFHNYRLSPLEPLFPFQFSGSGDFQTDPQATALVRNHPLLRGLESVLKTFEWQNYHLLESSENATDLIRLKNGVPLLSLREVGEGRVLSFNTDETWRLQFEPLAEAAVLGRLARRVLQYLTFDPEMDPHRIVSGEWKTGERVQLRLTSGPPSSWQIAGLYASELVLEQSEASTVELTVPRPDIYAVKVNQGLEEVLFETQEQPWRSEWNRLVANNESLQQISERSQGRFLSYEERNEIFEIELGGRQMIVSETAPWTRQAHSGVWAFLLLLLLTMFVDFLLRKRFRWDR